MSTDENLPSLAELRVMRLPEVMAVVGLKATRIAELEKLGRFPKRISIGDYAVAWREIDIRRWLAGRIARGYVHPKGATALNANAQPLTPRPRPAKAPERQHGPKAGLREAEAEQWLRDKLADGRWHRAQIVLGDAERARLSAPRIKSIVARICEKEGRGVGAQWRLLPLDKKSGG